MRNLEERSDPAVEELEAALRGKLSGPDADSWRMLRADVRSLASPIDPDFQARLQERFASSASATGRPERATPRRRLFRSLLRDPRLTGGLVASLAAIAVAILIAGPFSRQGHPALVRPLNEQGTSSSAVGESKFNEVAPAPSSAAAAPARIPGRVQELGASISLASNPSEIQRVADGVSRLAVFDGGYVQRSHVEVAGKASEATLLLSIPSAKLTSILTALGRLAPVRAESQSLQDITGSYANSKRRLADLIAERAALLRALEHTSTQSEIESLHRRLSLLAGSIARAQSAFAGLSRRASNSSIEVTVLADGPIASEGSTLNRGLHDAGRVLTFVLIGLLIGLAGVVPALLILGVLVATARRARRAMRERALL